MSTHAARFAQQLRNDSSDMPLRGSTLFVMQAGTGAPGTGTPFTLYTDRTKGTVASGTGQVTATAGGTVAFWYDGGLFDLYLNGSLFLTDAGVNDATDIQSPLAGGVLLSGVAAVTSPAPTQSTVQGLLTILPDETRVNDTLILVKRGSHSGTGWGNQSVPYGKGQVFELLSDATGDITNGNDAANPVLFRLDAFGGVGIAHGIHVATGLRMQSDAATPTQGIWVQPFLDCAGIIIDNPGTAQVPGTPTAPLLDLRDTRSTTYELVRVDADGTLKSNKASILTGRTTTDVPLTVAPNSTSVASAAVFKNPAGTVQAAIGNNGQFITYADDGATSLCALYPTSAGIAGFRSILRTGTATTSALALKGENAQSAALLIAADNNGKSLSAVAATGAFVTYADNGTTSAAAIYSANAGIAGCRAILNTIGTTTIGLAIIAAASQTADLFEALDSSAKRRFSIASDGTAYLWTDAEGSQPLAFYSGTNPSLGVRSLFQPGSTGTIPIYLKGIASQTVDQFTVVDGSNAKQFRLNKNGHLVVGKTAAPVLADLVDGEGGFYINTAGNTITFYARIGGALKTGTVAVA